MLKWLWRRRRLDDETRPEFETHLELLVDRYIRSGMTPDDARASDAVWRARFSSDPSVVGTTIHLSAEPYEIAGIAPAGFEDPVVGAMDAWLPYDLEADTFSENNSLWVFGRLRTGTVSGEFFRALAIAVLAGRTFDERDGSTMPMRAVVSANFARIAFPGMPLERVVGQRIAVLPRRTSREIIGVGGDVMVDVYGNPTAAVYSAHRQSRDRYPDGAGRDGRGGTRAGFPPGRARAERRPRRRHGWRARAGTMAVVAGVSGQSVGRANTRGDGRPADPCRPPRGCQPEGHRGSSPGPPCKRVSDVHLSRQVSFNRAEGRRVD